MLRCHPHPLQCAGSLSLAFVDCSSTASHLPCYPSPLLTFSPVSIAPMHLPLLQALELWPSGRLALRNAAHIDKIAPKSAISVVPSSSAPHPHGQLRAPPEENAEGPCKSRVIYCTLHVQCLYEPRVIYCTVHEQWLAPYTTGGVYKA